MTEIREGRVAGPRGQWGRQPVDAVGSGGVQVGTGTGDVAGEGWVPVAPLRLGST